MAWHLGSVECKAGGLPGNCASVVGAARSCAVLLEACTLSASRASCGPARTVACAFLCERPQGMLCARRRTGRKAPQSPACSSASGRWMTSRCGRLTRLLSVKIAFHSNGGRRWICSMYNRHGMCFRCCARLISHRFVLIGIGWMERCNACPFITAVVDLPSSALYAVCLHWYGYSKHYTGCYNCLSKSCMNSAD